MNTCDVEELKQLAVNRFLCTPTESFVELPRKGAFKEKAKANGDQWEWGLGFYNYNYALYLNGVEVASVEVASWNSKDDRPRWGIKIQQIQERLLKEKECANLMEALGMAQKQQAVTEEQKWPKRKWWQFRK